MRRVVLILVVLAFGCGESKVETPAPVTKTAAGSGVVKGTVKLLSAPPKMAEIPNQPCHSGAGPLKEETVVAGSNGTLANVVVYVKGLSGGDGTTREPVVMDQKDCRYVPHVIAAMTEQPVVFRSSDPTMHNVHYVPDHNAAANMSMTKAGEERKSKFGKHEFIRVKCDVHPWMTGYVAVMENPWFAVTGEDGTFEIKTLPNQPVTLVAWHEHYPPIEKQVDFSKGEMVEVSFEFK